MVTCNKQSPKELTLNHYVLLIDTRLIIDTHLRTNLSDLKRKKLCNKKSQEISNPFSKTTEKASSKSLKKKLKKNEELGRKNSYKVERNLNGKMKIKSFYVSRILKKELKTNDF